MYVCMFQCYESAGMWAGEMELVRPPTPGPPPAYETVVHDKEKLAETEDKGGETQESPQAAAAPDDTGLPSYEAALRIEARGYV